MNGGCEDDVDDDEAGDLTGPGNQGSVLQLLCKCDNMWVLANSLRCLAWIDYRETPKNAWNGCFGTCFTDREVTVSHVESGLEVRRKQMLKPGFYTFLVCKSSSAAKGFRSLCSLIRDLEAPKWNWLYSEEVLRPDSIVNDRIWFSFRFTSRPWVKF